MINCIIRLTYQYLIKLLPIDLNFISALSLIFFEFHYKFVVMSTNKREHPAFLHPKQNVELFTTGVNKLSGTTFDVLP